MKIIKSRNKIVIALIFGAFLLCSAIIMNAINASAEIIEFNDFSQGGPIDITDNYISLDFENFDFSLYLLGYLLDDNDNALGYVNICGGIQLQEDGDKVSPSTSNLPPIHEKIENRTKEVTIAGKVWKIDPEFSYQATGIWKNPDPRQRTDVENTRLQELPNKIQKLKSQINDLNKELRYLQRIEKPRIKMRFSFGKPPHLSPGGFEKIINLGEFSMDMEVPPK